MSATSGALVGLLGGCGLLLVVVRAPVGRRPSLQERVGPYVRDSVVPSRLLRPERAIAPFPVLERVLAPLLADAVRLLERVLGGSSSVRVRLVRAGRGMTVEEFRVEQVLWGALGLFAGVAVSVLLAARGRFDPVAMLMLSGLGAAAGVLVRDRWLSREARQREQRMAAEFPTVAELLALAVAAGEGAVGALERVARVSSGELARELASALAEARAGASLVQALEGMAGRTALASLSRFVDGVAIAIERGTPLADVLRAQAVDAREAGRRALLETAGRKEIAMMVPVVFLVLPVTVVFALFPGFYGFSFSG